MKVSTQNSLDAAPFDVNVLVKNLIFQFLDGGTDEKCGCDNLKVPGISAKNQCQDSK